MAVIESQKKNGRVRKKYWEKSGYKSQKNSEQITGFLTAAEVLK